MRGGWRKKKRTMILGSHRKTSLSSDATQFLHQVEADSETETATVGVQLHWEVKRLHLLRGWVYRWAGLSSLTCPRGDSAASMRYLHEVTTAELTRKRRHGGEITHLKDVRPPYCCCQPEGVMRKSR